MIYVIADIHGSLSRFQNIMYYMPLPEEDKETYIIIAGDAGLNYGDYVMGALKRAMKREPYTFIVMRGNHDARYWGIARANDGWTIDEESGYAWENKYPNIKYIRDTGGVYEIDGHNILFIPGGYSVDKYYRIERGFPYEPREELSVAEADALLEEADNKEFDYIVSHVAPLSINDRLSRYFLDYVDPSTVSHWTEKICDEVYREHTWKEWLFGHYHGDQYFDDIAMTMVYDKYGVIPDDE